MTEQENNELMERVVQTSRWVHFLYVDNGIDLEDPDQVEELKNLSADYIPPAIYNSSIVDTIIEELKAFQKENGVQNE